MEGSKLHLDVVIIISLITLFFIFLSLAYRIGLRNGYTEGATFVLDQMKDMLSDE